MKDLKVEEIIKETNATLVQGELNLICKNFSKDTRTINPGDTYIGIKGENFDGSLFWEEALKNGAKCVIISKIDIKEEELEKYKDRTILKVEDTLKALYQIAKFKRSLYNIPVIAITGSVGKTSTKDIIASVVAQKYKTLKTIGNNNNNIGLPFTILKMQDEEAMVLEMGMNHFGEIKLLSDIASPDICVITNIGTSHIGNLGSRENILKAKLEILEGTINPKIIINNDNDLLNKWAEGNKGEYDIVTYGIDSISDYQARDVVLNEYDSNFNCDIDGKKVNVKVPVGGRHFVLNALAAISVGEVLGVETNKIINGISTFELTKKRMDIEKLENGVTIINDTYNASLESMKASLEYLSKLNNKRKIAVLGDMLELGEYSKQLHEEVGEAVCENKVDILFCNGENSKYIVKKAKEAGMTKDRIYYYENKKEMSEELAKITKDGDAILFKASNGMKFFDIVTELKTLYKKNK